MKDYIVYLLTDRTNKKIYVGLTNKGLNKRWNQSRLQKRFGHTNFDSVVLFESLTKDEAVEQEKLSIEEYNSTNSDIGYNISRGGGHVSEDTRIKISESNSGKKYGKERRKIVIESNKRRKISDTTKQRMRESQLGKKLSKETKQKMSKSHLGKNNPNYGKNTSNKTKQILAKKCGKLTEEVVLEIRKRANNGELQKDISKHFGISKSSVSFIVNRKTWKHLP
jgi:group I intron endonuclease